MGRNTLCGLLGVVMLAALSGNVSAGNTSTNTSTNTSSDGHASNSSSNSSSNGSSNGAPEEWRHGSHCDEDELIDDYHSDVREDVRGGVGYVEVFEGGSVYECE